MAKETEIKREIKASKVRLVQGPRRGFMVISQENLGVIKKTAAKLNLRMKPYRLNQASQFEISRQEDQQASIVASGKAGIGALVVELKAKKREPISWPRVYLQYDELREKADRDYETLGEKIHWVVDNVEVYTLGEIARRFQESSPSSSDTLGLAEEYWQKEVQSFKQINKLWEKYAHIDLLKANRVVKSNKKQIVNTQKLLREVKESRRTGKRKMSRDSLVWAQSFVDWMREEAEHNKTVPRVGEKALKRDDTTAMFLTCATIFQTAVEELSRFTGVKS